YRNLNATPGEELLRAWLLRVTLNVARNTLRGQSRSMVRDNEYHKSTAENGFFVEAPEEDYERRQAIEEARRALDKIKEPMRSSCCSNNRDSHTARSPSVCRSKRQTSAASWRAGAKSLRGFTVRSEANDDTVSGRGQAAKLFRR